VLGYTRARVQSQCPKQNHLNKTHHTGLVGKDRNEQLSCEMNWNLIVELRGNISLRLGLGKALLHFGGTLSLQHFIVNMFIYTESN
jgi:hypothetical protein